MTCEPRFQPILMRIGRQSIALSTKEDQLVTIDQAGVGMLKLLGEASVAIPLRLPLPPRATQTLRELRGEFVVLTPPNQLTFELPLASGAAATLQQTTTTVSSFRSDRATRQWLIGITLNYPAGTLDLESHQTWALERNRIELRHKRSKTILPTRLNPEIAIDEGRAFHITYAFADVPGKAEDWEVLYRTPAPPIACPVRFAFKDLPLP
jgi:hypothetical protein